MCVAYLMDTIDFLVLYIQHSVVDALTYVTPGHTAVGSEWHTRAHVTV